MDLYGDTGNVRVLKYHLDDLGIKYNINYLSIDDKLSLKDYDLVLIGASTEENRDICLNHLLKYKKDINNAIDSNKFFLVTGNALGMFGKKLYDKDALGTFNFSVNKSEERVSKEVILENKICKPIYGFMNHSDEVVSNDNPLFEDEGVLYKNFYGTYVLGPILSRNPDFLEYFLKKLVLSKDKKFKFKKLNLSLEKKAYDEFIEFKKTKIFNSRKA